MSSPPRFGAMMTLRDHAHIRDLEFDFFELLVLEDDSAEDIEALLRSESRCTIVHAPEMMNIDGRSELIDLADEDLSRRERFVRRINEISSAADRHDAATVVHPGGVRERPAGPGALRRCLVDSLRLLNGKIWLENMPRRYHIGGEKRYCSLCVHPEEFGELLPLIDGVTLDVSHAFLSVERGGNMAVASFFEALKGNIRHVHLSDAAQPDREGLQLGDGDLDISILPRMSGLPVLLEVWGGHLNGGEGFSEALRRVRASESWFKGCVP